MEKPQIFRISYNSINARINTLDLDRGVELSVEVGKEPDMKAGGMESQALADMTARLVTIYHAVQPILDILAALPLLPQRWRDALRQFVATLDQVASFKAGKDL
jgi:hypothetical protein